VLIDDHLLTFEHEQLQRTIIPPGWRPVGNA
jgi:hypothetical protein